MRSITVPSSHPVLRLLIKTRKRSIQVYERETVVCSSHWDDGSRETWEARTISRIGEGDTAVFTVGWDNTPINYGSSFPSFTPGENVLTPGRCLVRGGTFQGKTATPVVYLHPDDYQAIFG